MRRRPDGPELLALVVTRRRSFRRSSWTEARVERTLSGQELLIRPPHITDERALQALLYDVEPPTRGLRGAR